MSHATREECVQVVQRMIPHVLNRPSNKFKHQAVLSEPDFQHERLSTLSPEQFERISGAYPSAVYERLLDWDDELDLQ